MSLHEQIQTVISSMILSHSGWRGIFAGTGGEEDRTAEIGDARRFVCAGAAAVFAEYLRGGKPGRPVVLLGRDTRPTGEAMARAMIPVLLDSGCTVRYAGVTAAPEIMAWARSGPAAENRGFMYISASHNPVGHNGIKFGLADGGVLPAEEALALTGRFRSFMENPAAVSSLEKALANNPADAQKVIELEETAKDEAVEAYRRFAVEVAWDCGGEAAAAVTGVVRRGLEERPLGLCCDFNGSARCASIDRDFFENAGIKFRAINDKPGEIVHRIIPEGESLEPCRLLLEEAHGKDPAFVLGYVPDCDGDRGNLVIWDDNINRARVLEAQEVFALACIAELSYITWLGGLSAGEKAAPKIAVAVNDPTSLRINRVAAAFGAEVFRAEVGEANVVGLARSLREKGYTVRILGEGSNGGNITHPSAVRDPLHTVLALVKLLTLRSGGGRPGLFELWCARSGRPELYRPDFGLAGIAASLPPFVTTGVDTPSALLKTRGSDHGRLKSRYQQIFLRDWEKRKDQLKNRFGIYGWEAAAYNGVTERKGIADFGEAGKGGLKICFLNAAGIAVASIWMRGSATEPVFRIIADAEGNDSQFERELIQWQRQMATEAEE